MNKVVGSAFAILIGIMFWWYVSTIPADKERLPSRNGNVVVIYHLTHNAQEIDRLCPGRVRSVTYNGESWETTVVCDVR